MKHFAKIFIAALVVAMCAACMLVSVTAADGDPNALKPASDRVVFITDNATYGNGSGDDANNPLIPQNHENFDPSVQYPKYYLQSAFYQATEKLKETGGTVVVCGPIRFTVNEAYGSGTTTRDVNTAKFGTNTIKFTSVYNGVDYRKTNNAKITIETPACLNIDGQSIWENVTLETAGSNRTICFNYYSTLVGGGIECYPEDRAFEGVSNYYISLAGGHRYSGGDDLTTNLVVKSGTYNCLVGGMWGVTAAQEMGGNSTTNLTIDGNTTVLGAIVGTNRQNAAFSGNSNVTINGGNMDCDIYAVGQTGMLNNNGTATLKINGGKFAGCWSIDSVAVGHTNNAPSYSVLDFSGWRGSESEYKYALNCVVDFSRVIEANSGSFVVVPETQAPDYDYYYPETEEPETEKPETARPQEDLRPVETERADDDFEYDDDYSDDYFDDHADENDIIPRPDKDDDDDDDDEDDDESFAIDLDWIDRDFVTIVIASVVAFVAFAVLVISLATMPKNKK